MLSFDSDLARMQVQPVWFESSVVADILDAFSIQATCKQRSRRNDWLRFGRETKLRSFEGRSKEDPQLRVSWLPTYNSAIRYPILKYKVKKK